MAQTEDPAEPAVGIAELQRRMAETRVALSRDAKGLAWETDIGARLKQSIRNHQTGWIVGAAAAGLVFAALPRRRARPSAERSGGSKGSHSTQRTAEQAAVAGKTGAVAGLAAFALTLLKLLFPVIRPALTELAADAFERYRNRGTPPAP